LGINVGEAIGPVFGGSLSNIYNFDYACGYTSVVNLIFVSIFTLITKFAKPKILESPKISSKLLDRYSEGDEYKAHLIIPIPRRHSAAVLGYGYKSRSMSRSSFSKRTSDINVHALR
jgi:hypothetical protein